MFPNVSDNRIFGRCKSFRNPCGMQHESVIESCDLESR
jgi:hypothetical protein